jgi:CheY-like chemotaxis protein
MAARRNILLVEDDEALRHLLRHALSLAGYHVTEARAGFEALQQLDWQLPDIIVLDLMMPGIDGFTVRTELASQARTRHIPIIVITAASEDLRWLNVRCLLRKPVSPDEVIQAIDECLASGASF